LQNRDEFLELTTGNVKLAGGAKITASQSFFEREKNGKSAW
jgi:hypothetical protein